MKISKQSAGFTLVEIMIVVSIIGLLAALGIPGLMHSRSVSQATACFNNLRQIDGAKQQWALEAKKSVTDTPTAADLQSYLGRGPTGQLPVCPLDSASTFATSYTLNDVQTAPACNVGATSNPPHTL